MKIYFYSFVSLVFPPLAQFIFTKLLSAYFTSWLNNYLLVLLAMILVIR